MKDLTKDSITGHIVKMAAPATISMLAQIAYQLVDLYFITRLGTAATAGVSAAGNAVFVVTAMTQTVTVGTVSLIAHSVGRSDWSDTNRIFNESMMLSLTLGAITVVFLWALIGPYMRSVATDGPTIEAGITFMRWIAPGYALMVPMAAIGSALRGAGVVQPQVVIYLLTVVINIVLAPILIAGWGTGVPLGLMGGGLATTLSVAVGVLLMAVHVHGKERHLKFDRVLLSSRRLQRWRQILAIGLPASGEYTLIFLSTTVIYYAVRHLGPEVQAGVGIGSRILDVVLLPALAIALAAGPIAGQNFGARNNERVRETFRKAALIGGGAMFVATALVQWRAQSLLPMFDAPPATVVVTTLFLHLMSWALVAQGLVFLCQSMFRGLGNSVPPLLSASIRFLLLTAGALWLSARPGFRFEQVLYLLVGVTVLQASISLWLLRLEFGKRLIMAK
jgi:putative MATE family efflux protein